MIDEDRFDLAGRVVWGGLRRKSGCRGFGLIGHEATNFISLAYAQIGGSVEAGALLREGGDNPETEGFGEISQFGER